MFLSPKLRNLDFCWTPTDGMTYSTSYMSIYVLLKLVRVQGVGCY